MADDNFYTKLKSIKCEDETYEVLMPTDPELKAELGNMEDRYRLTINEDVIIKTENCNLNQDKKLNDHSDNQSYKLLIYDKMSRKNEKKILKYKKDDLENALTSVRQNNMSIKAAARLFNIPRTTLAYKLKGKLPEDAKMGPKPVLSIEEENNLVKWIIEVGRRGFPVTKDQLLNSVKLLCKSLNKTTKFVDGKPGKKWYQLFLRRHPEVSIRTPQNLTNSSASLTETKIKTWFLELQKYFLEKNLLDIFDDPRRIFNSDESAFFMSPKGDKVLAQKGDKTVYSFINNDEKECLTILMTVNAAGAIAPPMVVYSYERIPAHVAYSVPPGWGVGKTESGWMTGESFFEYVANILHPWLITNNIPLPILYFVDGHASHLTLNVSNFCISHGIELIALYPNATHIVQPLDVAVFRPMKQLWKGTVHTWRIENDGSRLKREHFAPLLKRVIKELKQETIVNGFRTCGLCPFNSSAINFQKFFTNTKLTVNRDINLDMQNKLTFLENIIGLEKMENFKRNFVDLEDTTLYTVWTKVKNMVNQDVTVSEIYDEVEENAQTDVFQNIEENNPQINVEVENDAQIDTPTFQNIEEINPQINAEMEKGLPIAPNKDNEAGNNPDAQQQTPTKNIDVGMNIPTPFKKSLFWPTPKSDTKLKKKKEKLPSVATSESWRSYYENKENKKKKEEAEKLERKQKRVENKRKKEELLKEKETNRKKRNCKKQKCISSSSDSDNTDEVLLESDDDIEWDRASDSETSSLKEHIKINTYVIVKYFNQYYPGKIKKINEIDATYFVSSMVKSGPNYTWPLPEDCIWYDRDDIIKKILAPMPVNTRGAFKVPEMDNYE